MRHAYLLPLLLVSATPRESPHMHIVIDTVSHSEQRYDTAGDYWLSSDGTMHIRVSRMADPRHEQLVALHEMVELMIVDSRKIPLTAIDEFDMGEGRSLAEPGDDIRAPYHREHQFAAMVERLVAAELGVDWATYTTAVTSLK